MGHSLRDLLSRHDNTAVHKAHVTAIDLEQRRCRFDEIEPISYDYLVFGLGAEVNYFGTAGAPRPRLPDVHAARTPPASRITCSSGGRPPTAIRA